MTVIPAPPDLKPTIIQMQNPESATTSPNIIPKNPDEREEQPKKRRRRSSSSLISQSEIEKRRREHKTAHSIIEKKRRIRMNREFEALKFLIPACRNSLIGSGNGTSGGNSGASNNPGEGMYKLTILQATVDYIKYLHEVINIQQDDLSQTRGEADESEIEFAKIEIDTDSYRNVDSDFDFNKLFDDYSSNRSPLSSDSSRLKKKRITSKSKSTPIPPQESNNNNLGFQALPSPTITPELHPSPSVNSSSLSSAIKSDFQFPKPRGAFIASGPSLSSNCTSEFQITRVQSRSSSQGSSNNSPNSGKLEMIDEFSQFKNDRANSQVDPRGSISITGLEMARSSIHDSHMESDSANVLLSLKNDSVSSIRSLLN